MFSGFTMLKAIQDRSISLQINSAASLYSMPALPTEQVAIVHNDTIHYYEDNYFNAFELIHPNQYISQVKMAFPATFRMNKKRWSRTET